MAGLKMVIATARNAWVSKLGGIDELKTKTLRAGLLGDKMNSRSIAELYTCEGPSLLGMYRNHKRGAKFKIVISKNSPDPLEANS